MRRISRELTPFRPARPGIGSLFRRKLGPGTTIHASGGYRILSLLGKGGMGRVYLAEKLGVHGFAKLVAIKVLPKAGLERGTARMFLDEARLTAGLNHPNVVQVYQLGETRNEYFIVMEHVFGITLLDLIEQHERLERPVPIHFGAWIIGRVLSGLHYAHNKHNRDGVHLGIVHRDICPTNVLISFRGVPKLMDFGVAKAKTSWVENETLVTFGKYPYMAPEQVLKQGTEARSDLYSIGLVMYELFTGRLVHEVEDTSMLVSNLQNESVAPPTEINPDIPTELSDIILRAISLRKEDRFATAQEMRVALERFLLKSFLFPDDDSLAQYLSGLYPQAAKHRWW